MGTRAFFYRYSMASFSRPVIPVASSFRCCLESSAAR